MEYSPTCLNDSSDGGAAELIRCALGNDPLRVPSDKALEALTGEGALKAALLRVDLRIELQKAREPIELGLLGLDGRLLLVGRSPFLRDGLDKAVELCDLLPRQGAKEKVLGLGHIKLLDADNLLRLADLFVVNDRQMKNVFVRDFIKDAKGVTHADGVLLADALDRDIGRLDVVEASRQIELLGIRDLCPLCVGHAIDIA